MNHYRKKQRGTHNRSVDGMSGGQQTNAVTGATYSYRPSGTGAGSTGFNRSEGLHAQPRQQLNASMKKKHNHTTEQTTPVLGAQFDEPAPSARKERRSKRRGKLRVLRRAVLSVSLAAFFIIGGTALYSYLNLRGVLQGGGSAPALAADVQPEQLNGEGDGRVNLLMIGRGGEGHEAPDLTDSLIIASVDPIQNTGALLSIPRDFYITTPDYSGGKINAVYALQKEQSLFEGKSQDEANNDGIAALTDAIEHILDIPIHYHVMVDFTAFRDAIDTVGGIEIDVQERLYDPSIAWENNWNPLIADVGVNEFDGALALLYARSRMTSLRGDFDRAERQREVIVALQDKVLSVGTFANPIKIAQLSDAFGDNVTTNLSISEVGRLYELIQQLDASGFASLSFVDPPNQLLQTGFIGGLSVVYPVAGQSNYNELRSFVHNNLRDGFLAQENAGVLVLNGAGVAGLATETSELLRSYGYLVIGVDDAPTSDYMTTQLIDTTAGAQKFTRGYLEDRIGVQATEVLPEGLVVPEIADFVIILGQDEADQLQ